MAINVEILKTIARNRLQKPIKTEGDLIELLKIWWTQKYNKPDNHPLFLDKTIEELVIDYHTDMFLTNPESLKEPTVKQLEQDEEELKKIMGDEYHEEYDYLIPPTETEKSQGKAKDEDDDDVEEIIEEDFTKVDGIN